MFAFFSARLRRWLLFMVLLPVLRLVSRQAAARLERRNGPSRATRVLHRAGQTGRRGR
ncbi:MAG TPA: hypothetical protein VMZ00_16720 [Sporichthya sp.]|nr:hypothetical protein [Sporichthya sp.]